MKSKKALPVAAAALVLGVGVSAVVLLDDLLLDDEPAFAVSEQSGWTEAQWPFPIDQFGRGKAFRCSAADCGTPVTLYVRAKIGFCNCTTGVADDAELDRIGDLELLGGKVAALGDGHPIAVAWMKGRSRSYAISEQPGQSALSIGYNERCDAIVATAVAKRGHLDSVEAAVIAFLNGPTVMRWAEAALGL